MPHSGRGGHLCQAWPGAHARPCSARAAHPPPGSASPSPPARAPPAAAPAPAKPLLSPRRAPGTPTRMHLVHTSKANQRGADTCSCSCAPHALASDPPRGQQQQGEKSDGRARLVLALEHERAAGRDAERVRGSDAGGEPRARRRRVQERPRRQARQRRQADHQGHLRVERRRRALLPGAVRNLPHAAASGGSEACSDAGGPARLRGRQAGPKVQPITQRLVERVRPLAQLGHRR